MLHQIKAPQFYTNLGFKSQLLNPPVKGNIQGLYAEPNKGTTILYQFRFQKLVLNPSVKGKIQGLFDF